MKLWSLEKVFFILPSVNGRQVSLVLLAGVFRAGKEQTWDQADPRQPQWRDWKNLVSAEAGFLDFTPPEARPTHSWASRLCQPGISLY